MNSSRPYLLRALNEWIVDNGMTPQVLVDADYPDVSVPEVARSSNPVVLNIAPRAVRDLEIDNEDLSFVARFSGVSHAVLVPIGAVEGIFARETGQVMKFPDDEALAKPDVSDPDSASNAATTSSDKAEGQNSKRPQLKIIK